MDGNFALTHLRWSAETRSTHTHGRWQCPKQFVKVEFVENLVFLQCICNVRLSSILEFGTMGFSTWQLSWPPCISRLAWRNSVDRVLFSVVTCNFHTKMSLSGHTVRVKYLERKRIGLLPPDGCQFGTCRRSTTTPMERERSQRPNKWNFGCGRKRGEHWQLWLPTPPIMDANINLRWRLGKELVNDCYCFLNRWIRCGGDVSAGFPLSWYSWICREWFLHKYDLSADRLATKTPYWPATLK